MEYKVKQFVDIDGKYLYDEIGKKRLSKQAVSVKCGYSVAWLAGIIRNGRIDSNDLLCLCRITGISYKRLLETPQPYSPLGMPPRDHIQRKQAKEATQNAPKAYVKKPEEKQMSLFDIADPGVIRQRFDEILDMQQEINKKLLEISKEIYKCSR